MVGARGKSKASASKWTKSKRKAPSVSSAVPDPVDTEEASEGPLDGEVKKNETPSTDEKQNADATCGLVVGNGFEENQQLGDEGNDDEENDDEENDDEKNDDELNVNQVDSLSGETDEELEEVNDGEDAANDMDSENNEVDTDEENVEEVSDGGDEANNNDVEDNQGKTNEEVAVEVKEPTNDCHDNKDILIGEENKDMEVAAEGEMVTDEGLAASEHGATDEEMTSEGESDELNADEEMTSEGEYDKLNAEEALVTPTDNKEMANDKENVSIANNAEASPEEANKPKRKIIKKKVVQKKAVSRNDVASINEAKPQSSIGNDASGNANSAEASKHGRNEEKAEIKQAIKVNKKLNRKRKNVVSESHAGVVAASDVQKSKPTNNELGTEVDKGTDKQEAKGEKAEKSGLKASRLKKKRKQKVLKDDAGNVVTGDMNKPGPSRKSKSKKVDTMGMIFMCSSETKKDCYRYKVLGLPAGKKDFVLKIYKGMRLFLFDVELRMMYGIYKAAAPGGYNLEPRAFKSQFPSQVRFTVLEECVPLAEEKFKRVIKENYYTKNKFNFQLTSEQVRKLCKLFHENTKKAGSKRIGRNPVEAIPSSARRDRKRKRADEGRKAGPSSSSKRERRRRHAEEEVRRGPVVINDGYYQRPVVYEREAYLPPPAPVQVVYQALPPPSPPRPTSYSYSRPSRADVYRRDSALDRRELGLSSLRRPAEGDRREPYVSYRDNRTYLEPAYETGIRRDLYEPPPSARREHYDYTSDARRVEYYRAAEYRPPLPPYRRY